MKIFFNILLCLFMLICFSLQVKGETANDFMKKGQDFLSQGSYREAISCFQEALNKDSKSTAAYYYIGFASQKLGDLEGAIDSYKEAINYCLEKQQVSYIGLAQCEEKLNKPAVFTHYKFAVSFIRGYEDLFKVIIGQATEDKISAYEELASFHPSDPRVLKRLVISYESKGKMKEGTNLLKKILRDNGF